MNPEALKYSYDLFSRDGYSGSLEEYKKLISTNDEALRYSFNLFSNDGYSGNLDGFKNLVVEKMVPQKEEVETAVIEEQVPEAESKIDFKGLERYAQSLSNKNEGEDNTILSEEQLKQPIGSIDIFANRQPESVEVAVDNAKPAFAEAQEKTFIDAGEESKIVKAEQEYAQDFIDKKGYHDFTSADYLKPKAEEARSIIENITIDSPEVKESILAESIGLFDDFDFGNAAVKDLGLFASSDDVKKAEEEWYKDKTGMFVNMPVDQRNELLAKDEKLKSLINKDASGDLATLTGWKSPQEQLQIISTWDQKPGWYPQDKWDLVQKYKQDGGVSNDFMDNADPRLVNKAIQGKKQSELNKFFYDNDDLSQIERTKVSALLSDQLYGKLTYDDVMRMNTNPKLMEVEFEKNQMRQESIIKEMDNIKRDQEELESNEEYQRLNSEAKEVGTKIQELKEKGINANSSQAEINQYNALINQYNNINKQFEDAGFAKIREDQASRIEAWTKKNAQLSDDAAELGDLALVLNLAGKNYSALDKTKLKMEQFFLGNAFAGTIGSTSGYIAEGLETIGGSVGMGEMADFLRKVEGVAIDYNESINNEIQTSLAETLKLDDVSFSNLDSYVAHNLADGSPSIATVMMSMLGPKLSRGKLTPAQMITTSANYSKLAQGIFFSSSYGAKGMELAIAQKNAPARIQELQAQIDSGELNGFQKQEAQNQIDDLERVLDLNVLQKAGSSLLSGTIEMYSEKLGTLGYMKNINRIAAPVGSTAFKKIMYKGLNTAINVGTEVVEETAAQIGNNASDILILGEDKSLIDGIDKDFLANVAITSLAIQGPSIGGGLYNIIQDEVISKSEVKDNTRLLEELLMIQETLQSPLATDGKVRNQLKARRKQIIQEAGMKNIMHVNKLNNMTNEQVTDLFDINRQRRKILKNLKELGNRGDAGSKSVQRQKARLVNQFKELDTQRNELLSANKRRIQEENKEAVDPALANYNQGLYEFYTDIVSTQQELNGNKVTVVDANTTVEQLTETYGKEKAEQIIQGRDNNENATFVGDDVILYKDNALTGLRSTRNKSAALFAAVSPLHELMHINNRKQGIVKDGKVVSDANRAIREAESVIKENLDTGKITREQYDEFLKRKKQYTDESGVDVEEMLNLFGDMTAAGILSEYDFSKINGLKYALKDLTRKFAGDKLSFLFPLNTAQDVFSYIKSFKQSVESSDLNMAPPEEEVDEDLRFSKAASDQVQQLYDQQGEAAAFDIIEQFKPIVNKIVQRRSEAPGFDRQLLTDEIETGERGILDLIRSYDPESGVPLAAYINKFLPSRAIEASKRVLGEQFDEDVDEQVGLAAVEEADNEVVQKPTRKIKLKTRLTGDVSDAVSKIRSEVDNLPIDQLDFKSLKNIALEEVQKLFGIKPKPGNLTKQDVRNAQQFINNNAEALINMLPEGATPSGTSTGVQKVLLDNFYNKTERATMARTGSKAGLAIFEKRNNITPAEFKKVFGITPAGTPNISDRNTSARIKALVAQTERMLTNQEVREVLESEGRNIPQALVEGKNELMFSKGQQPLNKKQKEKVDKAIKDFEQDMGSTLLAEQSNWKDIVKDYGFDPINMRTEKGRQKLKSILFEGSKEFQPLINFLPKSFFTQAGTFTNGAENVSIKDANNKRTPLTKEQLDVLLKAKSEGILERVNSNEVVREYTLNDGSKILNTDPAFVTKDIQLKLKPVGTFLFANKLQLNQAIKQAEDIGEQFAEPSPAIAAAVKKEGYSNLDKKFKTENFKEEQALKEEGFKQIWRDLEKAIQLNPKVYAPAIGALFSSTSGAQRHVGRVSAPITFLNTLGLKNVEEHTEPASDINKYLFNRALQGNLDLYIDAALSSYFQGQLPDVFDKMLKGEGFNYVKNVPSEYAYDVLMGLKSVWIRYFNPQVNSQVRIDENGVSRKGIDPNVLIEANGKSVAENFGIGVEKSKLTPSVISKQQELLFQVLNNDITQEVASQRLKEFLKISPDIRKASKGNMQELSDSEVLYINENMTSEELLSKAATIDEALRLARRLNQPVKKIRVFDFDDTLATSNNVVIANRGNETIELNAEEFAERGLQLKEDGWEMDFSDFNRVTDGGRGPLFNVAKKIKEARGNEDLFVLTARAPQAQDAIYDFLKSQGLEFKKENIIGLGNSTGEAKANWVIGKAAEGYNDFYFADDALQNVKAVRDALDVIDVKSKVQQAKLKFSKGLDEQFDSIISDRALAAIGEEISASRAQVLGASKGNFKFFIPYSAEDFMGLIYPTLAKGKLGEIQMAWYKEHLLDPYARAMSELRSSRVQLMDDFRKLKKQLNVPKDLNKSNETGFTNDQAIRVYLYNKMGYDIPGMNQKDINDLIATVENNPQFITFAEELAKITKGDPWIKPANDWMSSTIATDLIQLLNTTKRKKFLDQWQQNADLIYSEKNLNKLEARFGPKYREALENMLARMKSGSNRVGGTSRLGNQILNYINGSNAAIMFFNTRSAILQTISAINFVNWSFNNPLRASAAFANQPQYWKDFSELINSKYLRDRRNGLRLNINENEIADAAKTAKNKAKGAMNYILQKGYLPTQYADSFAIAAGGATFYRNRIKDLMKQGMTEAQAKDQAMIEFVEISEESQQSSRPDKISQQQASDAGRLILMFANTPMQYARIQKRAIQDLINGRGDWKSNISKIAYYGFVQNLIFNALQQAVFAMGFGGEEEEKDEERVSRTINGMMDSTLRGLGIGGASVSVIKNLLLDIYERSKRSRPEYVDSIWKLLQFSPPIGSKISRLRSAAYLFNSKKRREEMKEKGFNIDNPAYEAAAKVVSATTNVPLDRILNKYNNIEEAFQEETQWWQTVAMLLGWPKWQLEQQQREYINNKRAPSSKRTSKGRSRRTGSSRTR